MKAFNALLKTEGKLTLRCMDSMFFGIIAPMLFTVFLGIVYGSKPAYAGAGYTMMQQSFGAVATIGICATGLMGIPLTVADDRQKKILKRFKVTPASPVTLLVVQFMLQFAIAAVSALLAFGVVSLFFGYRMTGSAGGFIIAYLLVILAIYSIGMLVASIAPNLKIANLLCNIIYFPMLLLSGATVPYELFPKAMQGAVNFLPLTQGIKLLKNISLGLPVDNLIFPVLLLIGLSVVCIGLSVKFFKWE